MTITPQCIHVIDTEVHVEGPLGPVSLRRTKAGIEARYQGDKLVNGSSLRYSESIRKAALHVVESFPFPWEFDAQGEQQITDHSRYYEQTFNADLEGIEMLRCWSDELIQRNV
ncbi:MAG: hypothetical protein ACSHX8_07265 [Opitutaceae bacterium]